MSYAIIKSGGKQYRVNEGLYFDVEKLEGEVGQEVTLDEVLLVKTGETLKVGKPTVEGASVAAEIVSQRRGRKIIVYKFRRRQNYRKKQGHRQFVTRLKVTRISA